MLVKTTVDVGVLSYHVTADFNKIDGSVSLDEVLLITRGKPLDITRDLDLWAFEGKPLYDILENAIYAHCTRKDKE